MRALFPYLVALTLTTAPAMAGAQDQTTPPPAPAPAPTAPPPTSNNSTGPSWLNGPSHWTAAGFIGSNFGSAASSSTLDVGGEVGYLYRGILGGEFLADFSPSFNLSNALLANTPTVNAYMFNLVAAAPFGSAYRFQPYLSGGFGDVQLRSTMVGATVGTTVGGVTTFTTGPSVAADDSRFGGDLGGGVLAFVGNVGVRGDIRYFRAFRGATVASGAGPGDVFAANLISGLDFWRANIGIAFRW